jgi:hypothetical protein
VEGERRKGGKEKWKMKKKNGKERKGERERDSQRTRAGDNRGVDRGLVGHARVVGRHAARRAEWEKEDGTSGVQEDLELNDKK